MGKKRKTERWLLLRTLSDTYFLSLSEALGAGQGGEVAYPKSWSPFGVFRHGKWSIPVLPPHFPEMLQKSSPLPWLILWRGESVPIGIFCSNIEVSSSYPKDIPHLSHLVAWLSPEEERRLLSLWERIHFPRQ